MRNGGVIPYDDFSKILSKWRCPGCMGVIMPTEEELEQRINEQIDRERVRTAILKLEIENLKKAVEKVENVSGLCRSAGKGPGT